MKRKYLAKIVTKRNSRQFKGPSNRLNNASPQRKKKKKQPLNSAPKHAPSSSPMIESKLPKCAPPIALYRQPTFDYSSPLGLGYLSPIFKLFVQPTSKPIDLFSGWETDLKYCIQNMANQALYYAIKLENKNTIVIDAIRLLVLKIVQVTSVSSPNKWTVLNSSGHTLGQVQVESGLCTSTFRLYDELDRPTGIKVTSTIWHCGKRFDICDDCQAIGDIVGWSLFSQSDQNMFAHQETISVSFPQDLDLVQKWMLLAIAFIVYD